MNLTRTIAFAALCLFVVAPASAQEGTTKTSGEKCANCPTSGQCPHAAATLTSTGTQEEGCTECATMTAAMAKLPKMTYKVGDESTCCNESATALAKEHAQPIHFVVAEKSYEDKTKAYTALVSHTEEFVNQFVTPHKCETSGQTTLAGHSCACPVTSAKYADEVKAAVTAVTMTYKVGKESCGCPTQAADMASKTEGAKVEYVVGEQCTSCEMTARMNLAQAKYKAAVAAITKATAEKSGS